MTVLLLRLQLFIGNFVDNQITKIEIMKYQKIFAKNLQITNWKHIFLLVLLFITFKKIYNMKNNLIKVLLRAIR